VAVGGKVARHRSADVAQTDDTNLHGSSQDAGSSRSPAYV